VSELGAEEVEEDDEGGVFRVVFLAATPAGDGRRGREGGREGGRGRRGGKGRRIRGGGGGDG